MSTYFVIFRQGRRARVAPLALPAGKDLPSAFRYEGRTYIQSGDALSTGDHFVTKDKTLVGFSFLLGGDSRVAASWHRGCEDVDVEAGCWLKVHLTDDRSAENDCCQLLYPVAYYDGASDFMLLLDECVGCWRQLGFTPASEGLPKPVFESASVR